MYKLMIINNNGIDDIKRFENIDEFNKGMNAAEQLQQLGLINDFQELHRA